MRLIIFLSIFLPVVSFANETKICESSMLDWILETKDCQSSLEKIRHLKSFSEIIRPRIKSEYKRKIMNSPWTEEFPHLYGLIRRQMNDRYERELPISEGDDFDLKLFRNFTNLIDLPYLPEYEYYKGSLGICRILKTLPHLRTVTIESSLLLNPLADNCLAKSSLEGVIIRDEFSGYKYLIPKTKVIGIEYYTGDFKALSHFNHLRYLGVSRETNTLEGIEALYKNSRLTHISLNIQQDVKDINKLGQLRSLLYLNVTCIDEEKLNSPFPKRCRKGSTLSDFSFISSLRWLKHLNLSYHQIKDISFVKNLPYLRSLKVKGNSIEELPSLAGLEQLTYLDLSGNKISSIEGLSGQSLRFLNLSGNSILDFQPLSKLPALEFLNLSHNPYHAKSELFSPSEKLRVLNLNGGGGIPKLDSFERGLTKIKTGDRKLLIEALFHDWNFSPSESANQNCQTFPFISAKLNLNAFENLQYLSMKNNQLSQLPDLIKLEQLMHLNIEKNSITSLASLQSQSLETILASDNSLPSFPRLNLLPKLRKIDLAMNDIQDIEEIIHAPKSLTELLLVGNLIRSLQPMRRTFPPDNGEFMFLGMVELAGNPIGRNDYDCPTNTISGLKTLCTDYLSHKRGNILDLGLESLKLFDNNISEWHQSKKCGVTTADI